MTPEEFLNARIDEDEALAHEAEVVIGNDLGEHRIAEWWDKPEHGRVYAGHWYRVVQAGVTDGDRPFHNMAALPHIANWDPHRVRDECEAKREIMRWHRPMPPLSNPDPTLNCYTCDDPAPCRTIRALALPYAEHPDHGQVSW